MQNNDLFDYSGVKDVMGNLELKFADFADFRIEKLDCHAMYLSGAGGNINSSSRIASENVSEEYLGKPHPAVK